MALPSFTITGTIFDLLGNVDSGEIIGNGLSGDNAMPATVTFTSNVPLNNLVRWDGDGSLNRVKPVVAEVSSDGTITRNGDPVKLLANDAGLSVDGLQWQVHAGSTSRFWFNAPTDGGTVDLGSVAPVIGVSVVGLPSIPWNDVTGKPPFIAGGSDAATVNALLGNSILLAKNFGVKFDAAEITAGMTASSPLLTKSSGTFGSSDVGKRVVVPGAGTTRTTTGGNGSITTGTTSFTTTTHANFNAGDIRSTIVIPGAGVSGAALTAAIVDVVSASSVTLDTAAGTTVTTAAATVAPYLYGTISSVASGVATLSASAGRTVSGAQVLYGTDDTVALNAVGTAISNAGGGQVLLPLGKGLITGPIEAYDYMKVAGLGEGVTVIYKASTAALTVFPAIHCQRTSSTPLTHFTIQDLTIDGKYTQSPTTYGVSHKGIQTEYVTGCTYKNLTVRNCLATGIATDWMTGGTLIHACRSINNGAGTRYGSQGGGGSGFGIGTGNVAVMDATISDCYASGNGNYGIFFETQNGTMSTGVKVVNCTAKNNHASGFSDCGLDGGIFANCYASGNDHDGFTNDSGTVGTSGSIPGQNTMWVNCVSRGNGRHGFGYEPWLLGNSALTHYPNTVGGVSWKNCKSIGNVNRGFDVNTVTGDVLDGLEFDNCEASQNGSSGLLFTGTGTVKNVVVGGGTYQHNGTTSGTDTYGIRVNCNTTNLTIRGVKAYDTATIQTQTHGLALTTGFTSTNIVVEGNDFQNNLTAPISYGATFAGRKRIGGNAGYGSTPSIAAGAAAGTSPSVSVVGDDVSGTIFVTVGTAPTVGTLATLTFSGLISTPNVVITPGDAASAVGGLYVVPATGSFALKCTGMPDPADTYAIYYRVLGT